LPVARLAGRYSATAEARRAEPLGQQPHQNREDLPLPILGKLMPFPLTTLSRVDQQ